MTNNFNKEQFKELLSENPTSKWKESHQARKLHRSWQKNSAIIALNVLTILEEKRWSKSRLAEEMAVSAAQISKIVKGQVNFTLESIAKLELALNQKLIDIVLVDRDREKHNHAIFLKWFEKSKSLKTKRSTKENIVINVMVKSNVSITRTVRRKEFNLSQVATDNLRPTG